MSLPALALAGSMPAAPAPRIGDDALAASISVFVADQHPVMVAGIEAILVDSPRYRILGTAATTDAAIEALAGSRARVALVEDALPGGGAFKVCRRLRELNVTTRVVVTSAAPSAGSASRAFDAGAVGF